MLLSYRVDWLAFSDPALLPRNSILDYEWTQPSNKTTTPLRGYNASMDMLIGRVDWHTERPQQRRLWTLTGRDLTDLMNGGMAQEELVSAACGVFDVRAARLDFAVDVREGATDPSDVEREWRAGRVQTHARKMTVTEVTTRGKGRGGKTVYIGSRQSQAFLRIYDKGAEQKSGEDWTRIELETKHPLSTILLKEMQKRGIMSTGTAAVKRCAEVPHVEWYTDALSGAGEVDLRVGRKQTEWEKWVLGVALPNVIKAVSEGVPGVRSKLERGMRAGVLRSGLG